ncbi:MAG: HNH endonuclease signature motif containing protein [Microthrixaceae bacterium]
MKEATGPTGESSSGSQADIEEIRYELDQKIGLMSAQIHSLQAELIQAIADFDTAGGWQGGGFRSYSQWLSIRTKFTPYDSQRLAAVAGKIAEIPTLFAAAQAGQISLGLLQAAARVSTPENEQRVAQVICDCTPVQASRVLSKFRVLAPDSCDNSQAADQSEQSDPEQSAAEPTDPEQPATTPPEYWWRVWYDELGRGRIDAALDSVTTALLDQAWQASRAFARGQHQANSADDSGNSPTADQAADQAAPSQSQQHLTANDIATCLASTVLGQADHLGVHAADGEHFLVQLNIDLATLARVLGTELTSSRPVQLGSECFLPSTGRHLADVEAREFLGKAGIQVLIQQNGVPLWLSKEHRSFTRHQRRALRFRSGGKGGCEFPGCGQTRFLHAHHVQFHSDGGATSLENGVLLCGYHHRRLHQENWKMTSEQPQQFTFWAGTQCLGSTNLADRAAGEAPDLQQLPQIDHPPKLPPLITSDTAKSTTRGEPLTSYALDIYLAKLLAA